MEPRVHRSPSSPAVVNFLKIQRDQKGREFSINHQRRLSEVASQAFLFLSLRLLDQYGKEKVGKEAWRSKKDPTAGHRCV